MRKENCCQIWEKERDSNFSCFGCFEKLTTLKRYIALKRHSTKKLKPLCLFFITQTTKQNKTKTKSNQPTNKQTNVNKQIN